MTKAVSERRSVGKRVGIRLIVYPLVVAAVVALAVFGLSRLAEDPLEKLPMIDVKGVDNAVARAVISAQEDVIESPKSGDAWGELAMILRAHDFGEESNVCYAQAEKLDPANFRWPYLHGVSLAITDVEAAKGRYRRAIEIAPDAVLARLRLAELLLVERKLDEAESELNAVLKITPNDPRLQLDLARVAQLQGEPKQALEWAEKSVKAAPEQRTTHELLALLHRQQKNADKAAYHLKQAQALPPGEARWNDPEVAKVLGMRRDVGHALVAALELEEQGRLPEAIAACQDAVQRDPSRADARIALGRMLVRVRDFENAATVLDGAIQIAPTSHEAYLQRGNVDFLQERFAEAAESFRKAIERQPGYELAYYNLGHALKALGDAPGAIEAFQGAVAARSDYGQARINLAELLEAEGRHDEALAELKAAQDLMPDDPQVRELADRLMP